MRRNERLSEVGELSLIQRLGDLLPREPRWVVIGRGVDDAAALDLGGRDLTLLTCDAQVEGRHFKRPWLSAHQLGRRAAAVNLSDIAAMGGEPRAALASLMLPPSLEVSYYEDVMRGLGEHLAEHGAAIVGGNLAQSSRHVTIDVTLLGRVRKERIARRAGARPGDRILITGWPGESAAGLALLSKGATDIGGLVGRFAEPTPRVTEGRRLATSASSMIDVSDGVASDLIQLLDASRVDAEIDLSLLPISSALHAAAKMLKTKAWRWALQGGEAYELLCTAPPGRVSAMRRALAKASGVPLTEIGVVRRAGTGRWVLRDGKRLPLTARGFQHFQQPVTRRTTGRRARPRT